MTRLTKTVETQDDGRLVFYYDPPATESGSDTNASDDG